MGPTPPTPAVAQPTPSPPTPLAPTAVPPTPSPSTPSVPTPATASPTPSPPTILAPTTGPPTPQSEQTTRAPATPTVTTTIELIDAADRKSPAMWIFLAMQIAMIWSSVVVA